MNETAVETVRGSIFGMAAGNERDQLVLGIHGWSQRNGWHTWQPLMRPLADAGLYVVSVDMPGWGRSEAWSDGSLDGQLAAMAVIDIIAGLGKESAVLMGKSWGGGVALEVALSHPTHVTSLVLTAPAFRDIERLKQLTQPLLLAWAKDDPVIPYRYAATFEAAVPDATLVTYDTGGHSAAPKNAEAFAPVAVTFLKNAPG